MPLREVQPQQIDPNAIRREHVHLPKVMAAAAASSSNNSRSGGLLLGEETPVESHAIATAASVLDGTFPIGLLFFLIDFFYMFSKNQLVFSLARYNCWP